MGHPSPHAYALRTSSRDLRPRPPPGLASQPPARASPPPPRVPHPTKVLFTSALHWAQATPMDYYQFRHRANLIAILALIAAIAYAFYVIAGEGVITLDHPLYALRTSSPIRLDFPHSATPSPASLCRRRARGEQPQNTERERGEYYAPPLTSHYRFIYLFARFDVFREFFQRFLCLCAFLCLTERDGWYILHLVSLSS